MSDKKSIKAEIRKQLKAVHNWNKLSKHVKKKLSRKVMDEVITRYKLGTLAAREQFNKLQLQPIPSGVMSCSEMKNFIATSTTERFFSFRNPDKTWHLSAELRAIDRLLEDSVLNRLLAPPWYTASKRQKTPAMFFRAELLKSLYFAEMSYRKFCRLEVNDLERKQNRTFIGLDLRRREKILHSELSMFRASLTWKQQLNLLVYFITHFFASAAGSGSFYYGIDSTDLAAKMQSHPLSTVTVTIGGQKEKISIYSQIDTDCGERRSKSDRSKFFVGYRVHSLAVLNPVTGKAYSLIPLVVGANHHDGNFLQPLVALGKALGLDIRLVVTDQAYNHADLAEFPELTLVTSPRTTVSLPEDVTKKEGIASVYCHQLCETAMTWQGRSGTCHEFHCGAPKGVCPFELRCPRQREIPVDNGYFGHIPRITTLPHAIGTTRRHVERPYNLLKHRNGIDRITVLSQQSSQVVETIATIAILLIEIISTQRLTKGRYKQIELDLVG